MRHKNNEEGNALYTEVRKLSGNEYRDEYNLPISFNNSLIFYRNRKTLFKWDVGDLTSGQSKALTFTNRTKRVNQKRKSKKGDSRRQINLENSSNATIHGQIPLLTKMNHKNIRLKRKRDNKRTKRKRQKLKKEKKFSNKTETLENKLSEFKQNKTSINKEKDSSLAFFRTVAEEPKKKYSQPHKTQLSWAHKSFGKTNALETSNKLHEDATMTYPNQEYNEIINDKHDSHMPTFRSKWKQYAIRNFTSDINECLINNGGCEGLCINTRGSFRCHCPQGFHLDFTRKRCLDVNECAARNGHGYCQGECTNTWGSFRCGCQTVKGTRLADDKKSCIVIDSCSSHNCSHICTNTRVGAHCSCPLGFVLGNDWITCEDVNECQHEDSHVMCNKKKCENTIGSYKCT